MQFQSWGRDGPFQRLNPTAYQLHEEQIAAMSVFTQAELDSWEEDGYIVVREAVPKSDCDAVIDALWEFLEMDRNKPESWYDLPPWHSHAGMVELYHHQALWDNRQNPRIYEAFSELFGTSQLWYRIIDRVNMNPPVQRENAYEGFIHWDFDPHTWPIPLMVQGVLCLSRTTAEQGGFQCVPGSHLKVDEILATQPEGANPTHPELNGMEVVPIPGETGDLVIWHTALLHGNGPNLTDKPRLAQYIAMRKADPKDEAHTTGLIHQWQERLPMGFRNKGPNPADPRLLDQSQNEPAKLNPLGRRLVGLDDWD